MARSSLLARLVGAAPVVLALGLGACGSGGGGGSDLKATGAGPCESPAECQGDVCIALLDGNNPPIYCSEPCNGTCPDGFWCDDTTFALVGLDFCRYGDTPTQDPPEEAPRRPCTDDGDCEGGEICATYEGDRGCTLMCDVEDDCTPPTIGGFTFDYLTCAPDETPGATRDACLPDPACFANPLSCTGGFVL